MVDINRLEGMIESLKPEEDWGHGEAPNVGCLYTIRRNELRFV